MHKILLGDCLETLKTLPDRSVQCCVTSPPYYGLRDYDVAEQIGLEETPEAYVTKLVEVFREVKRVLKNDGTVWLNLGDSYASNGAKQTGRNDAGRGGHDGFQGGQGYGDAGGRIAAGSTPGLKPKDLIGIPWMVAFALRTDGWWLRSDIIWAKPNPMPESATDRCTKSHEYIFLLTKSARYFYDYRAIMEPANYDGRKDTKFKGSNKYDDQMLARVRGERWPKRLYPNGNNQTLHDYKHSGYHKEDGTELFRRDQDGIPARNKRDVWWVSTKPYKGAHFATYPPDLIEPCILAGSRPGDTILDPFNGSGTTGAVATKRGRNYIGCELNPDYIVLTEKRLAEVQPLML